MTARAAYASVAFFLLGSLTGCAVYGDAHVYGAYYLVSADDLHAATVAAQEQSRDPERIYAYRVVNADEIRLYFTESEMNGSYHTVERVKGK